MAIGQDSVDKNDGEIAIGILVPAVVFLRIGPARFCKREGFHCDNSRTGPQGYFQNNTAESSAPGSAENRTHIGRLSPPQDAAQIAEQRIVHQHSERLILDKKSQVDQKLKASHSRTVGSIDTGASTFGRIAADVVPNTARQSFLNCERERPSTRRRRPGSNLRLLLVASVVAPVQ